MSPQELDRRRASRVIALAQLVVTVAMLAGVMLLPGPVYIRLPLAVTAGFLLSGPVTRLALRFARRR